MFGDSLRPSPSLNAFRLGNNPARQLSMLLAGGQNYNVAENNRALPADRTYFVFNGYFNPINNPTAGTTGLQGYTLGLEKTFLDKLMSIDIRMPFSSGFVANTPAFNTNSGGVGNLSAFLKVLICQEEALAFSGGLGIGLPTGSDVVTNINTDRLTIRNEAVHLMPFLAATVLPNDDWFIQSFAQVDFAASGSDVLTRQGRAGVYTEQHLLHLDTTLGRWLANSGDLRNIRGIAGIIELHYTSTLQNSDRVATPDGLINVPFNRLDILNLTSGLHFQLTPLSNLRIGAVVPLNNNSDRLFDSQIMASFNRLF